MSSKKYIKKFFYFFIFFTSLANIIISIKLPMKSKTLEIIDKLHNNNKNYRNIRSLIERKMEITNYKHFLMETEICVSTPEQCFNVLYDTGTPYLILGIPNTNLKNKSNYNALMSDTLSVTCDKLFAIPFKSSVISAREVKDKVSILPKYNLPFLFSFVISWNSTETYEYEGILGLGNH